jgi:SynChlorMet cassette protein ScmC
MNLKQSTPNKSIKFTLIRETLKDGSIIIKNFIGILDLPEKNWTMQKSNFYEIWSHHQVSDIICSIGENESYGIEVFKFGNLLFPIYEKEINNYGLPFHAAFIEHDHQGILLAARGNIGKSTCCARIPGSWKALADDEALAVFTNNDQYQVHPFPTWSNFIYDRPQKVWDVQYSVPLKAIFFLEQAKSDKVIPLKDGEAATRIYFSSMQVFNRILGYYNQEKRIQIRKTIFKNACNMSKIIPSYLLHVSLDGKFWEEIDHILSVDN